MAHIQDGGRPPFWKSLNRYISVKNRPILMKFGTLHPILSPITVTWPKINIFTIQDGGGRHLENRFLGHNSSTDCPISAKFCTSKQNGMQTRATWQKLQIFKIQDGGRPPFLKSLNRHISQSHIQKLKFLQFKMAAAAILKIAFLAITHRPIIRFQRNFVWGSRTICRRGLHHKNC